MIIRLILCSLYIGKLFTYVIPVLWFRNNIVQDTLDVLFRLQSKYASSTSSMNEFTITPEMLVQLKKPLQVVFIGEEGVGTYNYSY